MSTIILTVSNTARTTKSRQACTQSIYTERLLADAHRSHRTSLYSVCCELSALVEVKDSTSSPTLFIPSSLVFSSSLRSRPPSPISRRNLPSPRCRCDMFISHSIKVFLLHFMHILSVLCARERTGSEIINLFTFFPSPPHRDLSCCTFLCASVHQRSRSSWCKRSSPIKVQLKFVELPSHTVNLFLNFIMHFCLSA